MSIAYQFGFLNFGLFARSSSMGGRTFVPLDDKADLDGLEKNLV
jgi:hypothetical protein